MLRVLSSVRGRVIEEGLMYLVFDVGATFIKYALMDDEGNISGKGKTPTDRYAEAGTPAFVAQIKKNKQGKIIYTLRDNDSITGTFLMNEILGPKDQIRIEDGAIITLGATTLILRAAEGQTEE